MREEVGDGWLAAERVQRMRLRVGASVALHCSAVQRGRARQRQR